MNIDWKETPHKFVGRSDRDCEKCSLPDRAYIHQRKTDEQKIKRLESLVLKLYERLSMDYSSLDTMDDLLEDIELEHERETE
jgi:DNA polymerase sigma